ncbi:MAG TPA: peptide chain release factor N(5)-glutamine methyltransferase [Chryseosolibacter sp.]
MKNSKALFQEIVSRINLKESREEIHAIVYILLKKFFGISRTDVMTGQTVSYPPEVAGRLDKAIGRINNQEPVQYVVGEQPFFGRTFQVNASVLIPRGETEELIRVVLAYKYSLLSKKNFPSPFRILDVGTGSGCIAITLSLDIDEAEVYGTDISNAALSVASENAAMLNARVNFLEHNILREKIPFRDLDVVVSNPPYVMTAEKASMQANVTDFEPHLALFVPDDDPLVFYREIARQAKQVLKPGGMLAVEINEKFAKEVSDLFLAEGFDNVQAGKDIAGKDRVVSGLKRGDLRADAPKRIQGS